MTEVIWLLLEWIGAVLIAPTAYLVTVVALLKMLEWTLAIDEVNEND